MADAIWSESLTFVHDPGHGWLKVPLAEIDALEIRDDISPYSFIQGKYGYLEEDMDYSTYINARRELDIPDPRITEQHVDYFDRNKRRFE